ENMSSICEARSPVLSMQSHSQPTSRTSTVSTESLPAQMDELRILRASDSGLGGPRQMDGPIARPRTGVYDASAHENVSGRMVDVDTEDPGQHSPDLSLYQVTETGHTSAQRPQSAKQLIHQFESMARETTTVQAKRPPTPTRAASDLDSRDTCRPFLIITPHKNKRSSLSDSLRTFMSVFKKKTDQERDGHEEFISSRHAPELGASRDLSPPPEPQVVSPPTEGNMAISWSTANALLSGPLLYLSRHPAPLASHLLPVWISCTVTLHDSRLLVTWYTADGNPSGHIVPLGGCMDVHSLALKHMDPDERALLPSGDGDLRTFELLFEDRPTEKFAATSSQDRGRWVSTIWDAVLSSQDDGGVIYTYRRAQKPGGAPTLRTDVSLAYKELHAQPHIQLPSAPEYTSSENPSPSALETATVLTSPQHTPPPTPVPKSPRHVPTGMSLSLPRSPTPLPITPSCSPSKSPSIANNGTLSVVSQHRAQIERSESASPAPTTATSSSVGTAPQRAQTPHSTRVRRAFTIKTLQEESGEDIPRSLVAAAFTDASIVIPVSGSASVKRRSAFRRHDLAPAPAPTPSSSATKAPGPVLRTKPSEPATREDVESPPASRLAVGSKLHLAPLAELIKDSAAKHYDQTAGLGEQIIALQRDINNLPKEIQLVIGQTVVAGERTPQLRSHVDSAGLQEVLAGPREITKQVSTDSGQAQINSVEKMLVEFHAQLGSQIHRVMEKLVCIEQLQTQLDATRETGELPNSPTQLRTTRNFEAPPFTDLTPRPFSAAENSPGQGPHPVAINLPDRYSKLHDGACLCRSNGIPNPATTAEENRETSQDASSHADSEKLQTILDYLKTDEEQRKLQLDQQAECVRYLTELNSWLDTFVNNGTVHIQSVAANVEHLCSQLDSSTDGETDEGQSSSYGILSEIKHLISSVQSKDQCEDQLRASVGELMDAVQEHLKSWVEQRHTLGWSILSSGERLRFVEAMKEATAINVQAHVEHFKADLSLEVAAMTQDIGRLHQEKQVIKQQIADLFAFYSKHNQEAEVRHSYSDRNTSWFGIKLSADAEILMNRKARAPTRLRGQAGLSNLQNLPSPRSKRPQRPMPHPVFQRGN
ncbi:hypothetical protein BU15DRAFT_44767, partial [Melanogaster broomeanus]